MSSEMPSVMDKHMRGIPNPFWRGKERLVRESDYSISVINLEW